MFSGQLKSIDFNGTWESPQAGAISSWCPSTYPSGDNTLWPELPPGLGKGSPFLKGDKVEVQDCKLP